MNDSVIRKSMADNLKVCMPFISTFFKEEEAPPDESPASQNSDTFSKASELAMSGKKPTRKNSSASTGEKSNESLSEDEIREQSYTSLLPKLLIFENFISGYRFWREYGNFLQTIGDFVSEFHVPSVSEQMAPRIFEDLT